MNENNSNGWGNIVYAILLPILSVGCSFEINYLETHFSVLKTVLILVSILIVVPLSFYLSIIILSNIWGKTFESEVGKKIKEIQINNAKNSIIDGIYRQERIAKIERTRFFEEIWVVSPDLSYEDVIDSDGKGGDGAFADVVQNNLKRGTKYKYFVPNKPSIRTRMTSLITSYNNNPNIKATYFSDEFFFLVKGMDIVIYEPHRTPQQGRKGFIGLPLQKNTDIIAAKMSDVLVDTIVAKLNEIDSNNY